MWSATSACRNRFDLHSRQSRRHWRRPPTVTFPLLNIGPAIAGPISVINSIAPQGRFHQQSPAIDAGQITRRSTTTQTRRWRAFFSALLIMNSSILWPVFRAAASQRGCLPRPDQVSEGSLGF